MKKHNEDYFKEVRRRYKLATNREKPKLHEEIPDGLGIGISEARNPSGELIIFLKGNATSKDAAWVVLGKYKEPRSDGNQFYVADRTTAHWADVAVTTYHEHLLMAVARVHEIKDRYDVDHNVDDNPEDGFR